MEGVCHAVILMNSDIEWVGQGYKEISITSLIIGCFLQKLLAENVNSSPVGGKDEEIFFVLFMHMCIDFKMRNKATTLN